MSNLYGEVGPTARRSPRSWTKGCTDGGQLVNWLFPRNWILRALQKRRTGTGFHLFIEKEERSECDLLSDRKMTPWWSSILFEGTMTVCFCVKPKKDKSYTQQKSETRLWGVCWKGGTNCGTSRFLNIHLTWHFQYHASLLVIFCRLTSTAAPLLYHNIDWSWTSCPELHICS